MKLKPIRIALAGIFSSTLLLSCIDGYSNSYYQSQFLMQDGIEYCYDNQNDIEYDQRPYDYIHDFTCVEPVFLDLVELRQNTTVQLSNFDEITQQGKLYVYQSETSTNYAFTIDHLKGVAIWELNFKQTMQTGYIKIPGVTDLSIRNNYLYANSFMDLVKINIADFSEPNMRLHDVFNYSNGVSSASLPAKTYFYLSKVDNNNNIIIGYKQTDSDEIILF